MPTISQPIELQPAWISWVGTVTTVLKTLGVECDATEVAGVSGYAFALSINRGLCPSGPTCLDWAALGTGVTTLGRSTLVFNPMDCFTPEHRNDRTRAHGRLAFEMASREVEAGRPCVVWGLGMPEFGVVRGVEDEEYVCAEGCGVPERVRWDELNAPGGPYVVAFPTETEARPWRHRFSIGRAVDMMTRQGWETVTCGLPAFDAWMNILSAKQAVRMGNSYNAQCWAEARAHAGSYVARLAEQFSDVAPLVDAAAALTGAAEALGEVAKLFPFEFEAETEQDDEKIAPAVDHLRSARAAEEEALVSLRAALDSWPVE